MSKSGTPRASANLADGRWNLILTPGIICFIFARVGAKNKRCWCQNDRLSVNQTQRDIQSNCQGRISPHGFLSRYPYYERIETLRW